MKITEKTLRIFSILYNAAVIYTFLSLITCIFIPGFIIYALNGGLAAITFYIAAKEVNRRYLKNMCEFLETQTHIRWVYGCFKDNDGMETICFMPTIMRETDYEIIKDIAQVMKERNLYQDFYLKEDYYFIKVM